MKLILNIIIIIIICVIYINLPKEKIIQNKKNIKIEKKIKKKRKNLKIEKFLLERSPYKDVYQLTIVSDNADIQITIFLTNHDTKYLKALFNKKIK